MILVPRNGAGGSHRRPDVVVDDSCFRQKRGSFIGGATKSVYAVSVLFVPDNHFMCVFCVIIYCTLFLRHDVSFWCEICTHTMCDFWAVCFCATFLAYLVRISWAIYVRFVSVFISCDIFYYEIVTIWRFRERFLCSLSGCSFGVDVSTLFFCYFVRFLSVSRAMFLCIGCLVSWCYCLVFWWIDVLTLLSMNVIFVVCR